MLGIASKPLPSEYPPYFQRYIDLVPGADPSESLEQQSLYTGALLDALDESRWLYRYEPSKWSVCEVLGHVVEVERMLTFWLWAFARGDASLRPPVDCEAYVREARFEARDRVVLKDEYDSVRRATLVLLGTLQPEFRSRYGQTSAGEMSVRSIAFVIAGHEAHHHAVLANRYGIRVSDISGSAGNRKSGGEIQP